MTVSGQSESPSNKFGIVSKTGIFASVEAQGSVTDAFGGNSLGGHSYSPSSSYKYPPLSLGSIPATSSAYHHTSSAVEKFGHRTPTSFRHWCDKYVVLVLVAK